MRGPTVLRRPRWFSHGNTALCRGAILPRRAEAIPIPYNVEVPDHS